MKISGYLFAVFSIIAGVQAQALMAQDTAPSLKLKLGTPGPTVTTSYGKPFEYWRLTASEYSASVGVPTGLWTVYHLNAAPDRMYVTMVHLGPKSSIDSLMLMPNGHWTVSQILNDQPELASICSQGCDVLRITPKSGNQALVLKPQITNSIAVNIIYFEGDSAEKPEWKSVKTLQGSPSWVYVLSLADFDGHHSDVTKENIGTWSPEKK
jgi:hypothetical protein